MTRTDERIRDEMRALAHPVETEGVLERVAGKRSRRRLLRRAQSAALAVAVLAGSAVGAIGLVHLFGHGNLYGPASGQTTTTPAPSPSATQSGPNPQASPAICDESQLSADLDGDGVPDEVTVFSAATSCDSSEVGQRYVLHVSGGKLGSPGGAGINSYGIDEDLPECDQPLACRLYAAPDIDGDGNAEVAVQFAEHGSTRLLALYRLEAGGLALSLVRVGVAPPGDPQFGFEPGPATLSLSDSTDLHQTLGCSDVGGTRVLVAGTAVLTDPGQQLYDVHFTKLRLVGSALEVVDTIDHHGVGWGVVLSLTRAPPTLCGAPIVAGSA